MSQADRKRRQAEASRQTPSPGAVAAASDRSALALAGAAALGVGLAYFVTLHPSVPGGDAGELILTAHVRGVAHPPGYPLHTLLARSFSLLPWGNVAQRVNLLSAVCGAGAAGLMVWIAHRWREAAWAGFAAAGLYAFSPIVWRYSVVAEVFSLNQLLVAALLALALAFRRAAPECRGPRGRALFVLMGLGLCNHHTFVFVSLPVLVWLRKDLRAAFRNVLWQPPLLFALGLAPYLYLVVAAAGGPPFSWGRTDGLEGFFAHLLRREFGTFQLGSDSLGGGLGEQGGVIAHLFYYFRSLFGEALYLGPFAAALGWTGRAGGRGFARLLAGALAFYLLVFGALTNLNVRDPLYFEIQARFWQLPNFLVFLLAAAGLAELATRLPRAGAPRWAGPVAAVLLFALPLGLRFREEDQRGNRAIEEYGRRLLAPLAPDAVLIVSSDPGWTATRYVQIALGIRPDVAVVSQNLMSYDWFKPMETRLYPRLRMPGNQYHIGKEDGYLPQGYGAERYRTGGYSIREFLAANLAQAPVYIEGGFMAPDVPAVQKEFVTLPYGLVFRVVRGTEAGLVTAGDWAVRARQALPDFSAFGRFPRWSWEYFVFQRYEAAKISLR